MVWPVDMAARQMSLGVILSRKSSPPGLQALMLRARQLSGKAMCDPGVTANRGKPDLSCIIGGHNACCLHAIRSHKLVHAKTPLVIITIGTALPDRKRPALHLGCMPAVDGPILPNAETNSPHPGVCFYQRESLPGYSAIFRHPNDELNFCYYLIPCGKDGMCGDVKVCPALAQLWQELRPEHASRLHCACAAVSSSKTGAFRSFAALACPVCKGERRKVKGDQDTHKAASSSHQHGLACLAPSAAVIHISSSCTLCSQRNSHHTPNTMHSSTTLRPRLAPRV